MAHPTREGTARAMAGPSASALLTKSWKHASANLCEGVTFPTFSALTSSMQASDAASPIDIRPSMVSAGAARGLWTSAAKRPAARQPTDACCDMIGDRPRDIHVRRLLQPLPARDAIDLQHPETPVVRRQEVHPGVVGLQHFRRASAHPGGLR